MNSKLHYHTAENEAKENLNAKKKTEYNIDNLHNK